MQFARAEKLLKKFETAYSRAKHLNFKDCLGDYLYLESLQTEHLEPLRSIQDLSPTYQADFIQLDKQISRHFELLFLSLWTEMTCWFGSNETLSSEARINFARQMALITNASCLGLLNISIQKKCLELKELGLSLILQNRTPETRKQINQLFNVPELSFFREFAEKNGQPIN